MKLTVTGEIANRDHCCFCFVQSLNCIQLFSTPWTAAHQAPLSSTISQSLLEFMSKTESVILSNRLILGHPFSFCLQSFPVSQSFPMNQLFASHSQSIGASASATVLPMNVQGWFPLGLTCLAPCCPRNSQESSPAPQFESINSSALSLVYGPALTSVPD